MTDQVIEATACAWTQGDEDGWDWYTDCKQDFQFTDGGTFWETMKYCCFCGRPVKPEPYVRTSNDAD